jgi:hypothetical protein
MRRVVGGLQGEVKSVPGFRTKRMKALVVLAAAAAIAAITSAAWAVIPDAEGVIHACYDREGELRVIDTDRGQTCRSRERPLEWSTAPVALSDAFVDIAGRAVPAETTGFEVTSLDLPAGRYVVTARAAVSSRGTGLDDSVRTGCALVTGDEIGETDGASLHLAPVGHPGEQGVITLLANADLAEAGSARLRCSASGNAAGVTVSSVVRAVEVGSITTHSDPMTPSP